MQLGLHWRAKLKLRILCTYSSLMAFMAYTLWNEENQTECFIQVKALKNLSQSKRTFSSKISLLWSRFSPPRRQDCTSVTLGVLSFVLICCAVTLKRKCLKLEVMHILNVYLHTSLLPLTRGVHKASASPCWPEAWAEPQQSPSCTCPGLSRICKLIQMKV